MEHQDHGGTDLRMNVLAVRSALQQFATLAEELAESAEIYTDRLTAARASDPHGYLSAGEAEGHIAIQYGREVAASWRDLLYRAGLTVNLFEQADQANLGLEPADRVTALVLSVTRDDQSSKAPQCIVDPGGAYLVSDEVTGLLEEHKLAELRYLIAQYHLLLQTDDLTPDDIATVRAVLSQAEQAMHAAKNQPTHYDTPNPANIPLAIAATAILADDSTGVGILDDPLLIPIGGLLLHNWLQSHLKKEAILETGTTQSEQTQAIFASANRAVDDAITALETVLFAQKVGKDVRGNTAQLAQHLARFLNTSVGGMPPDHQGGNPNNNKNHWWTEIKAFLKNIKDKGLSDKQLLRELRKEFSDEQLDEIREAVRRVAREMGEEPPNFPPLP